MRLKLGGIDDARDDKNNNGKAESSQEDVHSDFQRSHVHVAMVVRAPM